MLNSVNLIGRITRDIECVSYDKKDKNKVYANFCLAVQRDQENCDFIYCTAFGNTAKVLEEYTKKGSMIGVEGRLQVSSYEDKTSVNVIVNSITLCGNSQEKSSKNKKN